MSETSNYFIYEKPYGFFSCPGRLGLMYLDYVDNDTYKGDESLINAKITTLRFRKREMKRDDTPIRVLFATFSKRELKKVMSAMEQLDKKLTLLLGRDYIKEKENINRVLKEGGARTD